MKTQKNRTASPIVAQTTDKHKPQTQTQTQTQTASTRPTFETAKRDFETAYAAGDYAAQIQTLAQAVAVSVLRKCIDPQRKTAGTLDTVSKSGMSGALLDLRRGIFHDVHALDKVAQAGAAVVLTQYTPDGYISDAILDPDEKAMFDTVVGDTISDGMDLVHTAIMALLEQAADHAGAAGWLDTPYTVRRPSRKVLIKTDTATYKEETTTPVQEVYRAVRRAIADSRAVQTDPHNGYTYLEVETADGMDTVYLRTGKYADLGGYTRDDHAADSLPGAPAGYAGGYDPYTADRQTVDDYYAILARLDLTPRQREILEYRMQGYGYQAIASRLGIRESNVRTVLSRLQVKCAGVGFAPAGYTDTPGD